MKVSQNCIDVIKSFEGFYEKIYICPGGMKTIGYGHVVKNENAFQDFDQEMANELLALDIIIFEQAVLRNIVVPLTQGQFDALVSFTFNVGAGALQRSTLRQKINRLEFEEAPKEFMRWIYSNGQKLLGLVARRTIEVKLFESQS